MWKSLTKGEFILLYPAFSFIVTYLFLFWLHLEALFNSKVGWMGEHSKWVYNLDILEINEPQHWEVLDLQLNTEWETKLLLKVVSVMVVGCVSTECLSSFVSVFWSISNLENSTDAIMVNAVKLTNSSLDNGVKYINVGNELKLFSWVFLS